VRHYVRMSELDFLIGQTVEEFRYPANGLRVVFDSGDHVEPRLYADLEGAFRFVDSAGTTHVVDDDLSSLGAVFAVAGEKVERVSTTDGVLALHFSDGNSIHCEPDPDYEAWQVVGGDPLGLVICMPGGELAMWDNRDPPLTSLDDVDDRLGFGN
jgi:Family of unknown function (DUF6188)